MASARRQRGGCCSRAMNGGGYGVIDTTARVRSSYCYLRNVRQARFDMSKMEVIVRPLDKVWRNGLLELP